MEGVWVGRRAQLHALRGCWSSALDGRPQTVLVLGGRGSGRTTLVERALAACEAAVGAGVSHMAMASLYPGADDVFMCFPASPDGTP